MLYFVSLLVVAGFVLVVASIRSTAYNRGRAAGFADGRRFPLQHVSTVWPSPEEFQND